MTDYLSGGKLAGGNPKNKRVKHDYYATNPLALDMLLDVESFNMKDVLEPCVGEGHLATRIHEHYPMSNIDCYDIVERDYNPDYANIYVKDFLDVEPQKKYDSIITNPPFSLAQEFIENSINMLKEDGKVAMFLKIQFLESSRRKEFFEKYPPKIIYIFRSRMATWNNGQKLNPEGKRWQTTFLHAWFIWEKGFKGEPVIRWI